MRKVFVSGCYDILHAGHLQFFQDARALGDHLTVSFASDDVLHHHKQRRSSIPQEHKLALLRSLRMVDDVVVGENKDLGLDFKDHFHRIRPQILVVTEDDHYEAIKRSLCDEVGASYVKLGKTPPRFAPVSTSGIVRWIRAPQQVPLRVDFAGGWLDVPRLARPGGFVVNCAISPLVSLRDWPYEKRAGLGGSGAWAMLKGDDGVEAEIDLGVGWQDPAIIRETGLCVWRSGDRPALHLKRPGDLLRGRMALLYTGTDHDTPGVVARPRDYDLIARAGAMAANAVAVDDLQGLATAVRISYDAQLGEGMTPLPTVPQSLACKYCGGGWGGYAVYLFPDEPSRDAFVAGDANARPIEPYCNDAALR
jgi:cytidyltransferase-like protein